jgi:hypothetical protein
MKFGAALFPEDSCCNCSAERPVRIIYSMQHSIAVYMLSTYVQAVLPAGAMSASIVLLCLLCHCVRMLAMSARIVCCITVPHMPLLSASICK